jgi:uncharacterized membrane protein YdbT with pleckstrin-like domain
MAYVTSILRPDERVLAIGRMHWIIYKEAAIVLLLAIVCFVIANDYQRSHRQVAPLVELAGLFFLAAAVLFGIKARFTQWITEIAVTNLRVIYKRGFIKRYTAEMNMDKIESVTVTQSILGRMLDYGSVHVRGTGVGIEHLHQIRAPIMLRNCITAR